MSSLPAAVLPEAPLLIGYSGGLDSTVLLDWLWQAAQAAGRPLRAIHVHHGLQAEADAWAAHCQQQCQQRGIALAVHRVEVDLHAGLGLEAAARQARRAAFGAELSAGEMLVLAQHQHDQAETFLLHALRGSGVDGLAAMPEHGRLGAHALWRPLLEVSREQLLAHAQHHRLQWIEDPSNSVDDADRNFLRLHVLPLLRQRWPHASSALAGSAAHCAQTRSLLDEEDAEVLSHVEVVPRVLALGVLRQLPEARAARVLRRWVREHGAPPLPARVLLQLQHDVQHSASDRAWQVRWQDHVLRQWRDHLYLLPAELPQLPPHWQADWDGRAPLALPDGGQLTLLGAAALPWPWPMQVRARRGGERIVLRGRSHSHALKDCLQREHLAPWRRAQLPLLFAGEQLLAAADVVIAAPLQDWLEQHAARLQWRPGGW